MNDIINKSLELKDEIIENRRYLHQNAELGLNLPKTSAYIKEKLEDMGYSVRTVGSSGLCVTVGKPGTKTILLRADMDALPLHEESGLIFSSKTDAAHCCGHDMHAAMLLGVSKILKEIESNLKGTVKLVFQPGEEIGQGAQEMIDNGILELPAPDAVLAMHVNAKAPAGRIDYGKGCTFCSNDNVNIVVNGQGGHGARPHESIDPIKVAFHIYQALQTIRTSEINPMETMILTITSVNGGNSYNSISSSVTLKGTLRTYDASVREKAVKRIKELSENIAKAYSATANVTFLESLPPMYCSEDFTDEMLGYVAEVVGKERISTVPEIKIGSEDFALITAKYPNNSAYLFIGAGPDSNTGYQFGQHNTKVVFNEDVMTLGVSVMASCAVKWLENHCE